MIFPQIYLDYFKMRQDYCQSLNVWSYLPWIFFSFGLGFINNLNIISYRITKEEVNLIHLRLQPKIQSNSSFSLSCFFFMFLLLIAARILHRISIEMYEILWSLHVRIAQYVTIQFQREPTFVRFTDQGVVEEVELQIR
uniref:Uncharacterized protein n=1 Tax=Homo sapiens TaxID=9606 RepID=Q7Z2V2_HUMAN|nr:hypothetical protein [Homo sapiens]